MQEFQIQMQKLLLKNKQLQEMRYMVFQDQENVLNIAAQYQAVLDNCKQGDPLIPLYHNKLLTQIEISNMIHVDVESRLGGNQLNKIKESALSTTNQVEQSITNSQVKQMISLYTQNLKPNVIMISPVYLDVPQGQVSQFNQSVVQKIFDCMGEQDAIMESIEDGTHKQVAKSANELTARYQLQYSQGSQIIQSRQ